MVFSSISASDCFVSYVYTHGALRSILKLLESTPWNDDTSFIQTLERVTNSAKWQRQVITQGYTSIPGTHFVLKSGGGDEAHQQCLIHGVVHFKRNHKYVMHSGRSTIAGFTVAVAKQFTPLRDASGRPLFQVPLTHAQQIQRGSGY